MQVRKYCYRSRKRFLLLLFFTVGCNSRGRKKLHTKRMSNSKYHHPVGSRRGSSGGAECSCVAGLKLRCCGRERCCHGRRQRQPRFSKRDRPVEKKISVKYQALSHTRRCIRRTVRKSWPIRVVYQI